MKLTLSLILLIIAIDIKEMFASPEIRIIDGDTIKMKDEITHRLACIDTPERGKPYYKEAKQRLEELIKEEGTLTYHHYNKTDSFGRIITELYKDERNLNLILVEEGLAKIDRKHFNCLDKNNYRFMEAEAKEKKLNIWSQ